ncbi:MAG: DUF4113 domain-containing protein [Alphaproteobacteria bacterium]|nr:DUF4113 domain-containing protein [Alphaproteobacteria bacterium]
MSKLSVTLRKMTAAFGWEVWRSRATTAVIKRSLRLQIFLAPSPRGPFTGFGKKTMVLAREGMSRSGQLRSDHRSPRCATRLRDVPVVKEVGGNADVHPAVRRSAPRTKCDFSAAAPKTAFHPSMCAFSDSLACNSRGFNDFLGPC